MKKPVQEISRVNKRLYSVKEASEYLGRSVNGVRELVWSGKIRYVKIDRRVQIAIEDLNDLIEKSKTRFTY